MTNPDPFAGGVSTPSISWKDQPIGYTVTGVVSEEPKLVQARDFDTNEPAFYAAGRDGKINPKMTVVTQLLVDGEARGLWAPKPGNLYSALAATQAGGRRIQVGDILTVTLTGHRVNPDKPRNHPANVFEVTLQPGTAAAGSDPFGESHNSAAGNVHNAEVHSVSPTGVAASKADTATIQPAAATTSGPNTFAELRVKAHDLDGLGVSHAQIAKHLDVNLGVVEALLNAPAA